MHYNYIYYAGLRGKIIQFYIPKGASYYFGTDGEIVSNQIEWR